MKFTKIKLQQIIKEELVKEIGSEEVETLSTNLGGPVVEDDLRIIRTYLDELEKKVYSLTPEQANQVERTLDGLLTDLRKTYE